MVAVAVAGLHVEISGGAPGELSGSLDGEDLSGLGALGVEKALAGDLSGWSGDDAAKVGVGRGEAGGFVSKVDGASDVGGIERVGVGIAEYRITRTSAVKFERQQRPRQRRHHIPYQLHNTLDSRIHG